MPEILDNMLTRVWDWIDTRGVIRRLVLGITIWMLWREGAWAYDYALRALSAGKADMGVAAIMAAITAPATLLAGYVFKAYLQSREDK